MPEPVDPVLGPRAAGGRDAALRSFGQPNSVTRQFDFLDDRYEGRRLFAEFLGTFFLVLVAAGGGLVNARFGQDAVPAAARAVTPGLMVMAVILFMGTVSGAHLNPAVSVAFALRGNFPWRRVPAYIAAQFAGSVLSVLLLWVLIGRHGSAGLTLPGPGVPAGVVLAWETVLTAGLVSVILGTSSGAQQIGPLAAIGVGGYIGLAGLWGAPLTGLVGLPGRAAGRRGRRGRLRLGAARAGRRRARHRGSAGHAGRYLASGSHRSPAARAGPARGSRARRDGRTRRRTLTRA